MLRDEIISIGAIALALLLLMVMFGREDRTKQAKINLMVAANIFFIMGAFVYPFHRYPDLLIMSLAFLVLDICAFNKVRLKTIVTPEQSEAWHADPANWKLGIFYYNRKDTRIFAPSKIEALGWSINFGSRLSVLTMMAMVVIIFVILNALMV